MFTPDLGQVVGDVVRGDLLEERRSVDAYRGACSGWSFRRKVIARNDVVRRIGIGEQQRRGDASGGRKSRWWSATILVTKIPWPKIASLTRVGVMVLVQVSAIVGAGNAPVHRSGSGEVIAESRGAVRQDLIVVVIDQAAVNPVLVVQQVIDADDIFAARILARNLRGVVIEIPRRWYSAWEKYSEPPAIPGTSRTWE